MIIGNTQCNFSTITPLPNVTHSLVPQSWGERNCARPFHSLSLSLCWISCAGWQVPSLSNLGIHESWHKTCEINFLIKDLIHTLTWTQRIQYIILYIRLLYFIDLLFQPLRFTFHSVFFTYLKATSSCFVLNKKILLIFLFHWRALETSFSKKQRGKEVYSWATLFWWSEPRLKYKHIFCLSEVVFFLQSLVWPSYSKE